MYKGILITTDNFSIEASTHNVNISACCESPYYLFEINSFVECMNFRGVDPKYNNNLKKALEELKRGHRYSDVRRLYPDEVRTVEVFII